MTPVRLKVGELARRTGLTVRTLHHYDAIGLLRPSFRTDSGHRLYTAGDVARLQQVLSLRSLGLSLEEIRDQLGRRDGSPLEVIERHIAHLDARIAQQRRLRDRLDAIADTLRAAGEVPVEQFLQSIEVTRMIEKYYTPEQLEQLQERARIVGQERIKEVEAEWPALMAEVQAEMDRGTDPADPRVQELARRWMGLVHEFTGGDPGITASVKKMWQDQPVIHGIETGPVRGMGAYIDKALAASKPAE